LAQASGYKTTEVDRIPKEWVAESRQGIPNLKKMREEAREHLIEKVGRELRKWAGIEK